VATPNVLQRCEECLQREDCRASVRARGPALCEIETIVPVVDYDQALAAGYRAVTSKSRRGGCAHGSGAKICEVVREEIPPW